MWGLWLNYIHTGAHECPKVTIHFERCNSFRWTIPANFVRNFFRVCLRGVICAKFSPWYVSSCLINGPASGRDHNRNIVIFQLWPHRLILITSELFEQLKRYFAYVNRFIQSYVYYNMSGRSTGTFCLRVGPCIHCWPSITSASSRASWFYAIIFKGLQVSRRHSRWCLGCQQAQEPH